MLKDYFEFIAKILAATTPCHFRFDISPALFLNVYTHVAIPNYINIEILFQSCTTIRMHGQHIRIKFLFSESIIPIILSRRVVLKSNELNKITVL